MQINHVLVLTNDLEAMTYFWTELIGLEIGERPPFPFDGVWIYDDNKPLIHIAEQPVESLSHGPIAHVAIEGANYAKLMARLNQHTHNYIEKDVPLTGERQVFISGPNGLTLEMLFPLSTHNTKNNQSMNYTTEENFEFLGGQIK